MRPVCPSFRYEVGDSITIVRSGASDSVRLCFGDLWVHVEPECIPSFARSLKIASLAMNALLPDVGDAT